MDKFVAGQKERIDKSATWKQKENAERKRINV